MSRWNEWGMMSEETKNRVIKNLSPFFPEQEIRVEPDSIIPLLEFTLEDIARYAVLAKSKGKIIGVIPRFSKEHFVASIYFQDGWFGVCCSDDELKQAIETAINREY